MSRNYLLLQVKVRPNKKVLVSRPSAHHFWRAQQEKLYFSFHWIWCNWHCNQLFFGESTSILSFTLIKIRAYPILRSTSMIEIHLSWYVENVKIISVEKISVSTFREDKNKNRTRPSLFQFPEDGKRGLSIKVGTKHILKSQNDLGPYPITS